MQMIVTGFFVIYSLIACNSITGNNQAAAVKPTDDITAAVSSCYAFTHNSDTIVLNITTTGNTFSGHMVYQLKERDRNNGTLKGIIKGDTLIADYTFSSGGMLSVRQVSFLKQYNNLIEGIGEVKLKNNRWVLATRRHFRLRAFYLRQQLANSCFIVAD